MIPERENSFEIDGLHESKIDPQRYSDYFEDNNNDVHINQSENNGHFNIY